MSDQTASLLLVDDYPDTLDMWAIYLRSHGYAVSTADNGLDALIKARDEHPNLVILDLDLPGISGYEVARRLRGGDGTATMPLIAATGYSAAHLVEDARDAGFNAVIIKPCDPEGMVRTIETVLAAH